MLTKDKVRKTVDRLPENFTVDQIVEELVILNRIEEGLKDIEDDRVFTTDQVKKEINIYPDTFFCTLTNSIREIAIPDSINSLP